MAKYTKIKKQAEAILKEAGITNVEVRIEDHYNGDYDRTDYYLCGYYESWDQELRCHSAQIDKWFTDAKLFGMFFTQRVDWLKGSTEVKKYCWDNQIHPAEYKAPTTFTQDVQRWKKGMPKDYTAKIQYWTGKVEQATTIKDKAIAQTRLDHFQTQQELLTANC